MTQPQAVETPTDLADLHGVDADSIDNMYLTFAVGEEFYAVAIAMVTEIVGMQRIMSVPDVPKYIKGVINLRGKVIPLLDVRLRFGMDERPNDDRTVVIVLEVDDAPVGLIVDRVSEVVDIPTDRIDRAGAFGGGNASSIVKGLGRIDERVAILIDVPVMLSNADLDLSKIKVD
ncbi:chemotaxis protein CheW [Pseudoprimorskyibacter insulae]|uniref:Chemotaxis protein CheW n=1 Tax=Pseudoprimorskyibacter insulae TaxID=1695997 RepID=A0A2R8AVM3_9RHOB|nr:chemotaxis protein CheW [Pseudoprimorskyibacter insulae]SPF80073.1 Chemotaxis protein CheW [Pseudoprimorskyibacter insulae]